MSRATFSRRLPEFVDLFNSLGAQTRARTALILADSLLGNFAGEYAYASGPLVFSRIELLVQQVKVPSALTHIQSARKTLAALQLADGFRGWTELELSTVHAAICGFAPQGSCDESTVQGLYSAVSRELSANVALKGSTLNAAVAYAVNRAVSGRTAEREISDAIDRTWPTESSSTSASEQQAYVLAARAFIATSEGRPDALHLAVRAAKHEAVRLSELLALQPFETAPLGLYSRAILELAALAISKAPTVSHENAALLLTITELLNQSQRSIESRFHFLVSQLPDEEKRASFQSMHRIEQRLWQLKRDVRASGLLLTFPEQQCRVRRSSSTFEGGSSSVSSTRRRVPKEENASKWRPLWRTRSSAWPPCKLLLATTRCLLP